MISTYLDNGTNGSTKQSRESAALDYQFTIRLRFLDGLSSSQEEAFRRAAARWSRVIVGGLSPVFVDGETIQDILILAEGVQLGGRGGVLGQAGPTFLRPASAKRGALLPAKGEMQFDSADLERIEADGRLDDVVAHEMGHVLGIGTAWFHQPSLVDGVGGDNPTFRGPRAMLEYARLRGSPERPTPVPLENTGGPGREGSHWRETIVDNELMSGVISARNNPLSRLSIACLADLGYEVNFDVAEKYALPDLLERAERGRFPTVVEAGHPHANAYPFIPSVLPHGSLR